MSSLSSFYQIGPYIVAGEVVLLCVVLALGRRKKRKNTLDRFTLH